MTKIEIPTYRTLRENQVYFRDGPVLEIGETSQMIYLTRFKAPNLDEVLDAISTGTRISVQRRSNPSIRATNLVDQLLERADPKYVDRLSSNMNPEDLEHLKRHFSEESYSPDQKYLFLRSSCLPRGLIESAERSIQQLGRISPTNAEIILHKLLGASNEIGRNKWAIKLQLDQDWGLPNISDVLILLKYETKVSSILNVSGDYQDYTEIRRHLIYLNEAIQNGEIAEIENNTGRVIDESACVTLEETLDCIKSHRVVSSLIQQIGTDLKESSGGFGIEFPMGRKRKDDSCLN